jgi:hypothetical protein
LLVVGLLVVLAATGCRSISTLKQRCVAGDASACESACKKGVAGEGGCFHAGNLHRERAAQDFGGNEFRQASDYFVKSCNGGYGEGCLLSAELIEAPYAPDPAMSASDAPKAITDAEVKTREKRLERACKLGSTSGCKRLGDVLIGKAADRAKAAYASACKASTAAADCTTARNGEVDQAERWRVGCVGYFAADCTHLGDLLYQVDPPRAVRLFISECQLRQVAELIGGVGQFVHERIGEARYGALTAAPAPAPANAAPAVVFDVVSPVVKGPVAVAEILHAFASRGPELGACVDAALLPAPEIPLELIIDATGAVYRARATGNAPAPTARCIESVARAMPFGRPPGPATVTLTLRPRASKAPASSG